MLPGGRGRGWKESRVTERSRKSLVLSHFTSAAGQCNGSASEQQLLQTPCTPMETQGHVKYSYLSQAKVRLQVPPALKRLC